MIFDQDVSLLLICMQLHSCSQFIISMSQHSQAFHELNIQELLSDGDFSAIISPRAKTTASFPKDLEKSFFCDEDYYQRPTRRKTLCLDNQTTDPTMQLELLVPIQDKRTSKSKPQEQKIEPQKKNNRQDAEKVDSKAAKTGKKPQLTVNVDSDIREKPVAQSEIVVRSKQRETLTKLQSKNYESNEEKVRVIVVNQKYCVSLKQANLEVSEASIKQVYTQLLEKDIFVPLYPRRLQEGLPSQTSIKHDPQPHILFTCCLNQYLTYLHKKCPQQFQTILLNACRSKYPPTGKTSLFRVQLLTQAIQSIKSYIFVSKIETLKRVLVAKWRTVREVARQAETWGVESKELQQQEEQLCNLIGRVELLACFEDTERHCSKKLKENCTMKIKQYWSKYLKTIRQQFDRQLKAIGQVPI